MAEEDSQIAVPGPGEGSSSQREEGKPADAAVDAAAAADEKSDQEAAAAVDDDDDCFVHWVDTAFGGGDDVKWVEMPLDYMAWILAQKREDYSINIINADSCTQQDEDDDDELAEHRRLILKIQARHEAGKEEFFAFQEWIRDTFERNGRVMMPEHIQTRNEKLLEEVWAKAGLGGGDD